MTLSSCSAVNAHTFVANQWVKVNLSQSCALSNALIINVSNVRFSGQGMITLIPSTAGLNAAIRIGDDNVSVENVILDAKGGYVNSPARTAYARGTAGKLLEEIGKGSCKHLEKAQGYSRHIEKLLRGDFGQLSEVERGIAHALKIHLDHAITTAHAAGMVP